MKQIFIFLVLCILIMSSCQKENEWVQIDSIQADLELTDYLDSIFSEQNSCLTIFDNDTLFHVIFSSDDIKSIDNCNEFSEVDFKEYTMIVGKIMVSSISDKLGPINLSSDSNKYLLEVSIDKCTECYAAIGYLYFWELYPKLNAQNNFEMIVAQN